MKGKNFTSASKEDNVYTPYSMTEQLLENEKFDNNKKVLEPCCGDGAVVEVLGCPNFRHVTKGDIKNDYNFFDDTEKFNYIITNPPYSQLDNFIKKAKEVATDKFAFLCKITHLGGVKRFTEKTFLNYNYPLTKIYMFTRQANLKFFDQEKEIKNLRKKWLSCHQQGTYQDNVAKIKKQIDYPELREDGKYPAGMYYYVWLVWEKLNNNELMSQILPNICPVFKWIDNDKYILRKKDAK